MGFTPNIIYGVPNQIIQWSKTIVNNGNTNATSVVMDIALPDNLFITLNKASKGYYNYEDTRWYVGDLKPGEHVVLILDFLVISATSSKVITTSVSSSETDINPLTNTDTDYLGYSPLPQHDKGYREFLICINGGGTAPITLNYLLANEIGEYTFTKDGNVDILTFINEDPNRDGSDWVYANVNNIDSSSSPASLHLEEYHGNKVYMTSRNRVDDTVAGSPYESFIYVRYYNS